MPQGSGVIYPQGCRPVTEELGHDELIRRLKTLAHTLQAMGQDEGMYQQYIPLALHLAGEFFLQHSSKDVQLLIACCIADVLRVYAPEAPYKNPDQVKTIFFFIIKQLSGLKDPKDPAFKRYFYLLENLAYVKSFNMCFELEENQDIFCALFSLIFDIVNDEHSEKVKSFMLDVMCPLISESDMVSHQLLDIILINIVEPYKSQRRNTYVLAKELINKCSDTLEAYIQTFFNQVLLLGKEDKKLSITSKAYDLIYELNKICSSVLLAVLPQLECKLKSSIESERLVVVNLLAKMFSEKNSSVARKNSQLWKAFIGRFNDVSPIIRIKCVQHTMHFLLNHPELRDDVIEALKLRQHDQDENVRLEVVLAVSHTAKHGFDIVSQSEDLFEIVRERTLDKKFKVRKEAFLGLATIYRGHSSEKDLPPAATKAMSWIKDKILHGYYMNSTEDRLLIERLLNTSLVPYNTPASEKMKKLYHLMGTIDDNATKAFLELQKHQALVRTHVKEWIEIHKRPAKPEREKEIHNRTLIISKFLPDPLKAQEFLQTFSENISNNTALRQAMETITRVDTSCAEGARTTGIIMKKLGQPVMTNLYYNTVKMLLERMSSVMVDSHNIQILIDYVRECLNGSDLIQELELNAENAAEKGLQLLVMLSYIYPYHFIKEEIVRKLIDMLNSEYTSIVAPHILSLFTFVGKYKPLYSALPEITKELIKLCQNFATKGTKKETKQAIRCLYVNVFKYDANIFNVILETIKENLVSTSDHYITSIIALGHIAYNVPHRYTANIKNMVSRKIVRDLLVKKEGENHVDGNNELDEEAEWCERDKLSKITIAKLEGIKMMARWLLGLKDDSVSAQKTFRMFSAYISKKGNLTSEISTTCTKAEAAWIRLAAGCAMIKIAEQKGVGDQYTPEQYYLLSQLMLDEVPQVRQMFLNKLHRGLTRGLPNKVIPTDFMGFYCLAFFDKDKQTKTTVKQMMISDINRRREFIKGLMQNISGPVSENIQTQIQLTLPDYMIVYAIAILSHCHQFTDPSNIDQLTSMKSCLWFIMEPLILKNDTFSFGFYKEMLDKLKNMRDSQDPDDEIINTKMWALVDLAMTILYAKSANYEANDAHTPVKLSMLLFQMDEDVTFVNDKLYIPPQLQYHGEKTVVVKKTAATNMTNHNSSKNNTNSIDYTETNSNQTTSEESEESQPVNKKRRTTRSSNRS